MAEDQAFQTAMKEAASAAWEQDWKRAIEAYTRAVKANPGDPSALSGLGLALFQVGRDADALQVYERVARMTPNDPLPQERVAQIMESKGRRTDAAQYYLNVGEMYAARRDTARAIPNWERAVFLNPDLAKPHSRLATAYEADESKKELAVYAYLHLARCLQAINQQPRAEQALLRAQQLSPINPDVRDALASLKVDQKLPRVENDIYPPGAVRKGTGTLIFEEEESEPEEPLSPTEEALRAAMGQLADLMFSGQVPEKAQGPLFQAAEAYQLDDLKGALALYEQVEKARLNHPALRVVLGLLAAQSGDTDRALRILPGTEQDPAFALASNLAQGTLLHAKGQIKEALPRLISALHAADRSVNSGSVDEKGYERLRQSWTELSADQQMEMSRSLSAYLADPSWKARLTDSLEGYAARDKISYVTDLVEIIIEGGQPEIAAIMQRLETWLARQNYKLAKEEAQQAIERAPEYLPAHARLADILIEEKRLRDAADKINLVAIAYQMRGKADKAADLFARVIEIWPADESARKRVLEMLREQGRVVEALRHYTDLGDLFHRTMLDTDRAMRTFDEALSYAKRNEAAPQHVIPILKNMAEIESGRLNTQKALSFYERVLELAPDDVDAARQVIDMYFQIGAGPKAIGSLDNYLRYLLTHGQTERIVSTLEDQVRRHPNEVGLRQRLADVYRQQKRIPDAIGQLDAVGELLLEAGRLDEARATIRKIMDMNPPDIDGYRQLLAQLDSAS